MRILVTGGAGYIGAHTVARLKQRGDFIVVVDDLSTGIANRVEDVPLVSMDLADGESSSLFSKVLSEYQIEAVIHFAGKKRVDESLERPDWYFQQNMGSLHTVLEGMLIAGVRKIVFSSSAAVYGEALGFVSEASTTNPLNPYGQTKLLGEKLISQFSEDHGFVAASLRYFNVAGSDSAILSDTHITNLIPIVVRQLALDQSPEVFGIDYPTKDGSCIRDFIHVADLADAHLEVLDDLGEHAGNQIFNVGTGHGYSVLEVIDFARALMSKTEVQPILSPRRPGDPAEVVATVNKIHESTGWQAKRSLEDILQSTIQFVS